MHVVHAIILSVVEGVSEFLPISSTGHMILIANLLRLQETEYVKSFEIVIQLGAILSITVLYRHMFLRNREVWIRVLTAFIPTGVVGFIFYSVVKNYLLGNTGVTICSLLIGGMVILLVESSHQEREEYAAAIEHISVRNSFLIGLAQSLAIIPGVSRSAATIIGALICGTQRKAAVEFSFLLAVPTMLAASVLDIGRSHMSFTSSEWTVLVIGLTGSFLTAILTVKMLIRFIKVHTFVPFGIYRIVLAAVYWTVLVR